MHVAIWNLIQTTAEAKLVFTAFASGADTQLKSDGSRMSLYRLEHIFDRTSLRKYQV
jgi:hypothetical protein